jgi:hypothetical protein
MGWSHGHVAGAYHGWMLACGSVGVALLMMANNISVGITVSIVVLVFLAAVWVFFGISRKWGRFHR